MSALSFYFDIFNCMGLIQLKSTDLKDLRLKWAEEQDYICPLFGNKYPIEDFVIDHQHKLVSELPDETGKGLCRGAIHFQANSIEGKITNAFKRYGGDKHTDLISYLKRLVKFLESNKIHADEKYIHPTEKPKEPKLTKISYNKLVKKINGKQKVPKYNGKLTKALEKLFEKYDIEPVFKKSSTPASPPTKGE